MLKKQLIIGTLAIFMLLASCSNETMNESIPNDQINDIREIELIDEENQHRIGKEVNAGSSGVIVVDTDENGLPLKNSDNNEDDNVIPENRIVNSLEEPDIIVGVEIQEISISEDGRTPGVIAPNGVTGILTQKDGSGWECKKGDTISWTVEKYPLETGTEQALVIGIVKDGIMYKGQAFSDSLDITYHFDVVESGNYYVYFICASSDPISLKEGDFSILN